MGFSILSLIIGSWWALVTSLIFRRRNDHFLLHLSLAVMLVIHFVVPAGLGITRSLDEFAIGVWIVDNRLLKYTGLLYANLTLACTLIGYGLRSARSRRSSAGVGTCRDCRHRGFLRFIDWMTTLGIVGVAVLTNLRGTSGLPLASLGFTLSKYMCYGLALSVFHNTLAGRTSIHMTANLVLFALQLLLKTGERSPMLAVGLAYLMAISGKRNRRATVTAISSSMVVAVLAISWQFVRWQWRFGDGLQALLQAFAVSLSSVVTLSLERGELGYLYKACQGMMAIVPRQYDFMYGDSLVRLALAFIPSSLFPLKPPETQLVTAGMLGVFSPGASRPVTFMGDAYINFGWFGAAYGVALGYLIRLVQESPKRVSLSSLAISALGPYAVALWLRGTLNGISVMIVWWLISRLSVILSSMFSGRTRI